MEKSELEDWIIHKNEAIPIEQDLLFSLKFKRQKAKDRQSLTAKVVAYRKFQRVGSGANIEWIDANIVTPYVRKRQDRYEKIGTFSIDGKKHKYTWLEDCSEKILTVV